MIRFSVSPISLVIYPLYVCFFGMKTFVLFMSAVLVHESGHIAVILLLGQRIDRIKLNVGGLDIQRSGTSTYLYDAWVSLGGPLSGFIAAVSAWMLGNYDFFTVSLIYSVVNLFPITSLDGGCFFQSVLYHFFDYARVEVIVKVVNSLFLFAVYLCAVMLLLYTQWNASLLAVLICVFVSTLYDKKY